MADPIRRTVTEMYSNPETRAWVALNDYPRPTAKEVAEYEIIDMSTEFFADVLLTGLEECHTSWSFLLWDAVHKVPAWAWDDFLGLLREYMEYHGVTGKNIRDFCNDYKIDDVDYLSEYRTDNIESVEHKVKMFECVVNMIPSAEATILCKWIYKCARREYKEEFDNMCY
jgi:hypothetical protein